MADLLYEIGTEELPAGYLEPALRELASRVERLLTENRLAPREVLSAGTPRRMAVAVRGIPQSQAPLQVKHVGPPAGAAFAPDGSPLAPAHGFARSKGVPVDALTIEQTAKGPYVVAVLEEPGQPAAQVLPGLLRQATDGLPFPKTMRWEADGFLFARPVRWLVAMLDEAVLPVAIAGVHAGRRTRGHAFLAPEEIELADADYARYCEALRRRHVVADIAERRETLRSAIASILAQHGSELRDEALLDEVTNMVEWPHAVEGAFDRHFLDVPAPVLVAAMKEHQRYFSVTDEAGRLAPRFVAVCDRTPAQSRQVREGNERVLLARLEDAKFFWEQDVRRPLDELVPRLAGVVFLGGLGDNLRRVGRLCELGAQVAGALHCAGSEQHVRRAARLCKADLLTGLVGEFPSLQGVVGRELARVQGEPTPVCEAMAEHYLPAGADDPLPATVEGTVLALADKLDVILGCFSLGLVPTGSQDPYALRRHALGVLLIVENKGLSVRLTDLLRLAREVVAADGIACTDEAVAQVEEFFRDRLYHAALDRGFRHDFVRAIPGAAYDDVCDFWRRLGALAECARRDWWPALVELVDRTYRIQRDAERVVPVRDDLLHEPLELRLAAALREHQSDVVALFDRRDYVNAAERYCEAFARLVHDFFEQVFVNVSDKALQLNRKSLCARVYHLFADRFADLYVIQTPGGPA